MSSNVNIGGQSNLTAPTPQNTPLTTAPISAGLSRPTVPDITEGDEPAEESDDGDDDDDDEGGPDAGGINAALASLVHGRLGALAGRSSGYIEGLPTEVKASVEGLKGVQTKQNELQNQYKHECLELEKKYLALAAPLYARRTAIIAGTAPATAEEIALGEKQSLEDDEEYVALPKDVTPAPSGIPQFWLTALRNHPGLSELITERDEGALKSLTDLRLEYLNATEDGDKKQGPGFKLIFEFAPNDYFENTTLEKTYIYQAEVGYSGDFVYDRAVGSEIRWKEDKDLTKEFEIKKQRNKNTNRTRLVRKARPTDSFFNFFSPPLPPTEAQMEAGDIDEDEMEEIDEKLEMDYQIGEDFKEKIIPRAIDFFTGKALQFEDLDDDEFDDEDDEEEDEFDEDSDDDEPEVPARRRGPPKGRGGAPAGSGAAANPEECQQQ